MEKLKITQEEYDELAALIHSDSSPVGIDAKATHILILKKLLDLEKRLQSIEDQLSGLQQQ
ncbi:MAG: hypothetical protein KTR24_18055 [Saprospiraceae bacterium]|nr:hypothetical protein [Saprospiraceae bacterium]